MASSGLRGPFPLNSNGIDAAVPVMSPGAYALGNTGIDGVFYIDRVGRSDHDVNDRLKDYLGQYSMFKFGYLSSAAEAFDKECRLYHDFNPPGNVYHPDRPSGTYLKCPVCGGLY
ncbi:hypothetical protein [Devosia nitrariae]|uniref:KTSC domain-containing protein n=1 Tax=Devosia nitrariae TaxID=2071872 RepID=A0ABQ5W1K1_9HYPH|nr:hypothetical protein [Devosia nitrariae]GLQ53767.1 hypothetical protein GCM10010862_10260 [Devosia nitrariae]